MVRKHAMSRKSDTVGPASMTPVEQVIASHLSRFLAGNFGAVSWVNMTATEAAIRTATSHIIADLKALADSQAARA
jgi:hypothetical protein